MSDIVITEQMLDTLRKEIAFGMSPKRFRHTAEVEKMAAYLGELYMPDGVNVLRAAALLHDMTKEYSTEMQLKICVEKDIDLDLDAPFAPKTLHAMTAAALIPERFPLLADETIISCVRWHTTGREGMTLPEKLIYLADYIDMSRSFEDCVRLREYFMSGGPEEMTGEQRLCHLDDTLILSFDMTARGLLEEGLPISLDTVRARNSLIRERIKRTK